LPVLATSRAFLQEDGGLADSSALSERPSTKLGGLSPAKEAKMGARSLFSAI